MKLTKSQRQAHANTFSDCIPATYSKDTPKNKKGAYTTSKHGTALAKRVLIKYHNIEKFNGNVHKVHTSHLCKNDSTAPNGFVCNNPAHLYFGTQSENMRDKTKEARRQGAIKQLSIQATCPHCGKTGQRIGMIPHHFDNCKHKPMAQALMDN